MMQSYFCALFAIRSASAEVLNHLHVCDPGQEHFNERLMLVPHAYLINDHKQSRREALLAPGDKLYSHEVVNHLEP